MRLGATAFLVVSAAVSVAACGSQARQDATTNGQHVDRSAAAVIAFPDRFRNVADKCDGYGHRVYVTSRGDSNSPPQLFVINDGSCSGARSR